MVPSATPYSVWVVQYFVLLVYVITLRTESAHVSRVTGRDVLRRAGSACRLLLSQKHSREATRNLLIPPRVGP